MKISKITILPAVVVGLVLLTAPCSRAQALSGSITNEFADPANTLWDISKFIDFSESDFKLGDDSTGSIQLDFKAPFTQDGKGKLFGSGSTEVELVYKGEGGPAQVPFQGVYTTKGSVTSSKGVVKLILGTKVTGSALFLGAQRKLSASGNVSLKFDMIARTISGRASYKATASGKGGISGSQPLSMSFGDLKLEAPWTLVLDPVPAGNKYTGTATITLDSGTVYPFTLTGTYTPNTGASKLTLTGTGAALGSKLQLKMQGSDITFISGKVSGQMIKIMK